MLCFVVSALSISRVIEYWLYRQRQNTRLRFYEAVNVDLEMMVHQEDMEAMVSGERDEDEGEEGFWLGLGMLCYLALR